MHLFILVCMHDFDITFSIAGNDEERGNICLRFATIFHQKIDKEVIALQICIISDR